MMGSKKQHSLVLPAATLLAIASVALLALSCGGGGGGAQPTPGPPGPQDLPDVVARYQYTGRSLEVGSSSSLSQSGGGGYKGFLRLIDPGENIEVGVIDGTGRSQVVFPNVQPKPNYLLQFDFTVPGNLITGQPTGSTQVVLNIPVRVDLAGNTVIDAQLMVPTDPTATWVEASYTMVTPMGTITRRFQVNMASGQVVDDVNQNGTFDDDPPRPDDDRDGLDDEVEHSVGGEEVERENVQLEQIADDFSFIVAGGETWIIASAFTEIEDERGQKREGLPLTVLAVGQVLKIKGFLNNQGQLIAIEIEILSGPFSTDDQPGAGGSGGTSDNGNGSGGDDSSGGSAGGSGEGSGSNDSADGSGNDDSSGGNGGDGSDSGSDDGGDSTSSGNGSDDGSDSGSGSEDTDGSGAGSDNDSSAGDSSSDDGNSSGGDSDEENGGSSGSGSDDSAGGTGSSSSGQGGEDDGSDSGSSSDGNGSGSDDSGAGSNSDGSSDSSGSGGSDGGDGASDSSGNGDDSSGSDSGSGDDPSGNGEDSSEDNGEEGSSDSA